ncbi:hypothetical protein SLA2020_229080 [Shorea laevis]
MFSLGLLPADHAGLVLCSTQNAIQVSCSVLEAELLAIQFGVHMARELRSDIVVVESDSRGAVKLVTEERALYHPFGAVTEEIH